MQTHERQSLSPAQVAQRLGVSRQTVYALLDKGALVGFRVGTARRVRPQDLDEYIERRINDGE